MIKIVRIKEIMDIPDEAENAFDYIRELLMTEDYEQIILDFRDAPKLKEETYEIMIGELYGWIGWDYLSEVLRYKITKNEAYKLKLAIETAKSRYFKNAPQTKETKQNW